MRRPKSKKKPLLHSHIYQDWGSDHLENTRDLAALQAIMTADYREGRSLYSKCSRSLCVCRGAPQRSASCAAGISYNGPQNLAQCGKCSSPPWCRFPKPASWKLLHTGHLICHRGGNPTYAFDMCLWGPVTHSSDGGCKWLAMVLFAQPRSRRRLGRRL